ncbi:helix-turn-helix domain-containing protein [Priestia megaterium]|uniref:Helix-turn-helix domain-containing protein n=1 Tax=Priestia megaterium TaxID=1404 RepID=A0A6M6E2J1_PRIMG|nr:XRE family transcriptional regulator [Priestia megaterium]QJX81293.1 helix-turn-helix domain-containing protein [Priestia megaterium]
MKDFNTIIGKNLKFIRNQRNLSLDKVAEVTGVSKTNLALIEKGTSSPSVNTLWKIASGLNVSFSYFMEENNSKIKLASRKQITPIFEYEKKMRIYSFFPYDREKKFEVFTVELDPGIKHESKPHNEGIEEFITVIKGDLEITVGEQSYTLSCGDAIHYDANVYHCFENKTDNEIVFQQTTFYSEKYQ